MAEQDRVCALIERAPRGRARATAPRALVTIAAEVIARYRAEKDRRGLLDYDDLIDKTLELLGRASRRLGALQARSRHRPRADRRGAGHQPEAMGDRHARWSPNSSPAPARANVRRTIFAVGDEKQSIFSFQGAAPRAIRRDAPHFEQPHSTTPSCDFVMTAVRRTRSAPARTCSARSTRCSARARRFASLTTDAAGVPSHDALPNAAPGLVETVAADRSRTRSDGDRRLGCAVRHRAPRPSPRVQLARRIAARSRSTSDRGDGARPVRPGDMLVLVRQRGALFEAIIRALKNAGIAVAGADRLVLTEHIAVMDLMALADALLLPDDDLALATRAEEPAVRLQRGSVVRARLGPRRHRCAQRLRAKAAAIRLLPPRTHARRLGAGARNAIRRSRSTRTCSAPSAAAQRFLARLGHEANDALDEFLNLALDYETRETPSLQGFVAWLRAAQAEVQARHGNRARRSARDDRARRQGAGGADRHPRRHHHAARRAATDPRLLSLPAQPRRTLVWARRAGRRCRTP